MFDSHGFTGQRTRVNCLWLLPFLVVSLFAARAASAQPETPSPLPNATTESVPLGQGVEPSEPPVSVPVLASPAKRLFYFDQNYGSESQFGALSVIVSVGFCVAGKPVGFGIYSPFDVNYLDSARELGRAYTDLRQIPVGYGSYGQWALQEFVPGFGPAFLPNIALHFLGEGMLSRKLQEYNVAQGMSPGWARLYAIATVVVAQQINELIEAKTVPVGDGLADTVVNNTLGILAFQFDGFARLFANDYVRLYYWPGQPLIDVRDAAIYNNSESYLLRATLGSWTRMKLNLLMGAPSNGLGLSYPVRGQDTVGVMMLSQMPLVPEYPYVKGPQTARFSYPPAPVRSGGSNALPVSPGKAAVRLTWDRDGSLLATLEFGFPPRLNVVANVYPGFVRVGSVQFGGYAYADESIRAFGLTLSSLSIMPGLRF